MSYIISNALSLPIQWMFSPLTIILNLGVSGSLPLLAGWSPCHTGGTWRKDPASQQCGPGRSCARGFSISHSLLVSKTRSYFLPNGIWTFYWEVIVPIGLLPLLINFLRIGMLTIFIASEGPRNKSSGNVLRKQLISNNTANNGPQLLLFIQLFNKYVLTASMWLTHWKYSGCEDQPQSLCVWNYGLMNEVTKLCQHTLKPHQLFNFPLYRISWRIFILQLKTRFCILDNTTCSDFHPFKEKGSTLTYWPVR